MIILLKQQNIPVSLENRDYNIKVKLTQKTLISFNNLTYYDSHLTMQEIKIREIKIKKIKKKK